MKLPIVTLHGICSDGPWQARIKPILEAHFDYHEFEYSEYLKYGFQKVLLGRFWALYSVTSILVIVAGAYFRLPWWPMLAALPIAVGFVDAYLLREAVMRRLLATLERNVLPDRRPHILAHSFGTYLSGRALRDYSVVCFRSVVLVGAVLNSRYDWRGMLKRNPEKFTKVLNEVASKDFVSRLAFFLQGLIPPLGHAGFRGFRATRATRRTVHNIKGDARSCQNCRARVHNVFNRYLGHNNLFDIVRAQTIRYWLPFLWDIDCEEYGSFLALCSDCFRSDASNDDVSLEEQENRLRSREWGWADGSLRSFLKQHIRSRRTRLGLPRLPYREIEDRVDCALVFVWTAVHKSVGYAMDDGVQEDASALQPLFPKIAAIRAAEAVLYD